MILAVICVMGTLLLGILYVAVGIFRLSCRLCGLERPPLFVAIGIVTISWLVLTITEALLLALTEKVYDFLGYPHWEARLACFFVGLPLDMFIATLLHKVMMREQLGKAIEVWFVQRLILLTLVMAGIGLFALYYLVKNG